MRTFLFCWNPNKWDWETLSRDAQSSATGKLVPDSWSCFNRKVQPGDRAFLMMLGRENRGIIASGWATSETYLGKHWDPERARRGEKCYRADCDWERLIDPDVDSPLFVTVLQKKLSAFQFGWTPQASGIRMPDELAESLEKLWAAHAGAFTLSIVDADEELRAIEGAQRIAIVRHRRREQKLRAAKLREGLRRGQGCLCCEVPGCNFNFHEVYGKIGSNYAQIHHLKPLADRTAPSETKLSDLAIVCANCHAMIHVGGACRPLKGLIHRTIIKFRSARSRER